MNKSYKSNIFIYLKDAFSFHNDTFVASLPKKIQTVTDIIPGATFHELEVTDLFGVIFEGNPLPGHFVLTDNWPIGVYPLRKDVNAKEVTLANFDEARKRVGPSITPDMEKWYKSFMQQARQVQKPATPVT